MVICSTLWWLLPFRLIWHFQKLLVISKSWWQLPHIGHFEIVCKQVLPCIWGILILDKIMYAGVTYINQKSTIHTDGCMHKFNKREYSVLLLIWTIPNMFCIQLQLGSYNVRGHLIFQFYKLCELSSANYAHCHSQMIHICTLSPD